MLSYKRGNQARCGDSPDCFLKSCAAFIAEQAAQCGYCTNGMIMQAKDLVTRNPNATLEQVKQGLANNLCKCGTHTRILKAVMRVVEGGVA